jgi:hypothetical protein
MHSRAPVGRLRVLVKLSGVRKNLNVLSLALNREPPTHCVATRLHMPRSFVAGRIRVSMLALAVRVRNVQQMNMHAQCTHIYQLIARIPRCKERRELHGHAICRVISAFVTQPRSHLYTSTYGQQDDVRAPHMFVYMCTTDTSAQSTKRL